MTVATMRDPWAGMVAASEPWRPEEPVPPDLDALLDAAAEEDRDG